RMAMTPLPPEEGVALFETALTTDAAFLLPVRLDFAALRARAKTGMLPPLMRGLVRAPARRAKAGGAALAKRLAEVPEDRRDAVVLELARSNVAAVLGHSSADAVDPEKSFQDLGFDSLASVELRNRLNQATGL